MVYRDGRPGYVYLASHPEGFLKIGFTVNLESRIKDHSIGQNTPLYIPPGEVALECVCHGNYEDEQGIHRLFARYRYGSKSSEWYEDSGEIRAHFSALRARQQALGLRMYSIRRKTETFVFERIEWESDWDLTSIPDDRLKSEWARRNATKPRANRCGHDPSQPKTCRMCNQREYRRERRKKALDK
jgi:hypothetical protein